MSVTVIALKYVLAHPGLREAQPKAGLCSCYAAVSFLYSFHDFCQPNYLNIYQTDLHQICRVGRITVVYEQPEVSFLIAQGTLP